jgi:hypothetical protein
VHECLYDNRLSIFLGVLVEDIAHEVIDGFAGLSAELNFFSDLFACSGVVFFMEVKIDVHVELHNFEDLHVKVLRMLDQLEVLDSDVDVW